MGVSLWDRMLSKLADNGVSEITTNGPSELFYREKGVRKSFEFSYSSKEEYEDDIANSLAPKVRSYFVYGNHALFEGPIERNIGGVDVYARCHVVLPPSCDTPQVTIAKRTADLTTLQAIQQGGSLTEEAREFIEGALKARLGIVFSGQTGAGKSTMLSACTKYIPDNLRIGVAEDSPELCLVQSNVSYLHSTPKTPGLEEKDIIPLEWCVSQFKRMRVDMLIVGETRGPEFYDYLVAANSGSEGCMTTLHANDAGRALQTMQGFAAMGSSNVSERSINRNIANAVDLIVQLGFDDSGKKYRVLEIREITDTVDEKGMITTNTLFKYNPSVDRLEKKGVIGPGIRKRFDKYKVDYGFMYANSVETAKHSNFGGLSNAFGGF